MRLFAYVTFATASLLGVLSSAIVAGPNDDPVRAVRPAQDGVPLLLSDGAVVAKRPVGAEGAQADRRIAIRPVPGPMQVTMEVLVDGRPLPTIRHDGSDYLPVRRMGAEYEIRVWNHGPKRVVAVVSVDGLSVIDGQPASEDRAGYVLAPYGSVVIKGWRRNMDTAAAFRFVDREKSYASLVGRPENIGVIGMAAFEELTAWPRPELERRSVLAPAGQFRTDAGSVGTEYGREIDSRVYYVPFVRSSHRQSATVYYDTPEALRRMGVPVDRPVPDPTPFPADPPRFAPPPPGYRGN